MFLGLILNISPNHFCSHFIPHTPDKTAIAPKLTSPKIPSQSPKPFEHFSCQYTLQYLHHFRRRIFRRHLKKHVHMVLHYLHRIYPKPIFLCYPLKYSSCVLSNLTCQNLLSIFRYPDQMALDVENSVPCPSYTHAPVIQEKALVSQAPLTRLTASRFPPASKLAGIQLSFL
jgi:hypothetical protein